MRQQLGRLPLPEYQLPFGDYRFHYWIEAVAPLKSLIGPRTEEGLAVVAILDSNQ